MPGGGQKGAGAVGEFVYSLAGAFLVGLLVGVFGPCSGGGGDATSDNNDKCEAAWYVENDNDPETVPAPVVDAPWCEQHNAAKRQVQEMEQQQEVTEQFQEAQP